MSDSVDLFVMMGLAPAAAVDQSRPRPDDDDRRRAEDDRAERVANRAAQPSFFGALGEVEDLSAEIAELDATPIAFDPATGICTQHVSPCPRFLCPRNLMFDFGTPFVDAKGGRWAPVTLNTGVEAGRRGRRSSWNVEDQAVEANWHEMTNEAIERFETLQQNGGELCASYIARGIRSLIEDLEDVDGMTDGEKLERRRQLDELTVVQLAAKMGVSDETLRLLTVESFAKIRAAAEEGGWKPDDGFDIFDVIEAALYGASP